MAARCSIDRRRLERRSIERCIIDRGIIERCGSEQHSERGAATSVAERDVLQREMCHCASYVAAREAPQRERNHIERGAAREAQRERRQ